MRFANPADMEPGMWFRTHAGGVPLAWVGVRPVRSRFAGRRRVRVLCKPGPSFVCDATSKFQIIDFNGGRA
jgi:hypothetical protein